MCLARGTATVDQPKHLRGVAIGTTARQPAGDKASLATWSEDFIFAGSSGFLLLVATLLPDYWYVSFFALVPFLYRIIRATPSESLRLGVLFGLSFFSLSTADSLITSPLPSLLKLFSGTTLFALFAWTVGWARQRWGFNPFILVFLWAALELGLVKLGFVGGLLGKTGFSHHFFAGLISLFGFLTVSAIILLINSLLVLAIVKSRNVAGYGWRMGQEDGRMADFFSAVGLFTKRVYFVPEGRAPPIRAIM
jgi:apolipoprotein N-acyltransferase